MPWANGRCMVWDFTCPDTLAASYLNRAVVSPGAVANDAEDRKSSKYRSLAGYYSFKPVAVETLGALGEEASAFFQDLGRRITAVTAETCSFQFLMQRLSVTLQRSNAACILGTVGHLWYLMNIFIYGHFFDVFADVRIDCEIFMSILWFIRDDLRAPDGDRNRPTVFNQMHVEM